LAKSQSGSNFGHLTHRLIFGPLLFWPLGWNFSLAVKIDEKVILELGAIAAIGTKEDRVPLFCSQFPIPKKQMLYLVKPGFFKKPGFLTDSPATKVISIASTWDPYHLNCDLDPLKNMR